MVVKNILSKITRCFGRFRKDFNETKQKSEWKSEIPTVQPFSRPMHVQNTQNNNFTMSLQYLKENVKDEVDFLPADKRQKFFLN